jgi:hypothetical protein
MTTEPYSTVLGTYQREYPASLDFHLPHRPFWTHRKCTDLADSLLSTIYDSSATEPDIDIAAWDRANGVQGIMHGRRSIVTDLGFVGFAPAASTIGDEICILFGGNVPFVIRKDGQRSRFVGECLVSGLMNGEAICGFDDNQIEEAVLVGDLVEQRVYDERVGFFLYRQVWEYNGCVVEGHINRGWAGLEVQKLSACTGGNSCAPSKSERFGERALV